MSNKARHNLDSLLRSALKKENIDVDIKRSAAERYREFMVLFLNTYDGSWQKNLWRMMPTIEAIVLFIGSVIGFYIIYYTGEENRNLHFMLWTIYFAICIIVITVSRIIPSDVIGLSSEAEKIKYHNVLRSLAAKITLFDIITELSQEDDLKMLKAHSSYIPKYNELGDIQKSVISTCNNKTGTITDSRQTNLYIENKSLIEEKTEKLSRATKQIVDICEDLFSGANYTAKIYLRTYIPNVPRKTEVLAAFSKYPVYHSPSSSFGSSWVKARGNPSQVWQCLEIGEYKVVNDFDGSYYKSLLLVCLPGRIGVLAITSSENNAFDDKIDSWVEKALAVSSRALVLEALG